MSAPRVARLLALVLALLVLAVETDAQKNRRGGRGGRAGGGAGGAAKSAPVPKGPIYLPGFEQAGKEEPPARPPKPAPARPKVHDPAALDPRLQADEVTAVADYLARAEEARQKFLREHFVVCDLDGNGWLSLREGEVTLSLSRDEFRRADADRDGRLEPDEFDAQQELLLARLGTTPEVPPGHAPTELPADPMTIDPLAAPAPAGDLPPDPLAGPRAAGRIVELTVKPIDLIRRYDADKDRGLDLLEIDKLFKETGLALSPDLVLAQMDPNESTRLEVRELVPIAWLVSKRMPETLRDELLGPDPDAAAEEARRRELARSLTHFGRLDANGDGVVDEGDLRSLQDRVRLGLRLRTLLSALDQDGDACLSEGEFLALMRADPR